MCAPSMTTGPASPVGEVTPRKRSASRCVDQGGGLRDPNGHSDPAWVHTCADVLPPSELVPSPRSRSCCSRLSRVRWRQCLRVLNHGSTVRHQAMGDEPATWLGGLHTRCGLAGDPRWTEACPRVGWPPPLWLALVPLWGQSPCGIPGSAGRKGTRSPGLGGPGLWGGTAVLSEPTCSDCCGLHPLGLGGDPFCRVSLPVCLALLAWVAFWRRHPGGRFWSVLGRCAGAKGGGCHGCS